MKLNPLTQIDFYKTGHIFQYPQGTEEVYSNFTPRSDRLAPVLREGVGAFDGKVVFFGLQGFMKDFLIDTFNEGFFQLPKEKAVSRYKRRVDTSLGPGVVPVEHIAALHDLGYLPIMIKALPEASRVNIKVPLFTVRNTLKEFAWVTNYLEDVLSNSIWKSTAVATIAYQFRRLLETYADLTGADRAFVDWQAHDFSSRGMSGPEDSARSSAGHLLSFTGTDAVASIDYVEDYYGADADKELIGGGVPATEHSVMSMGGSLDEFETYRRLISDVYPSGIVSIVSDTWDFWNVVSYKPSSIAMRLKDQILARKPDAFGNAKVVFRPDSGDPVKILTGYKWTSVQDAKDQGYMLDAEAAGYEAVFDEATGKYFEFKSFDNGWTTEFELTELREEAIKGAVECLWDGFGGSLTPKGYKLLNPRVGLIYGDSITLVRAQNILARLEEKGFASTNVVFGVGSFSYQFLSRDSFGCAMKATSGVVNGERREIFKDPVTDGGLKKSAKGLLRVEKEGDDFVLYDRQTPEQEAQGAMEVVFVDSKLIRDETLANLRARLRAA